MVTEILTGFFTSVAALIAQNISNIWIKLNNLIFKRVKVYVTKDIGFEESPTYILEIYNLKKNDLLSIEGLGWSPQVFIDDNRNCYLKYRLHLPIIYSLYDYKVVAQRSGYSKMSDVQQKKQYDDYCNSYLNANEFIIYYLCNGEKKKIVARL